MSDEILYKAKNTLGFVLMYSINGFFMIGIAIALYSFKLKYFSNLPQSLNNPLEWMPYVLVLFAIIFIIIALREYFLSTLCITREGLLIKQKKDYKVVLFENIKLIKKCRIYNSHYTRTYTLIKNKKGEDIFYPDIKDLNELIHQIRLYYPAFTNSEGIIESYDDDITKTSLTVLLILFVAIYSTDKVFHMDINSIWAQTFLVLIGLMFIGALAAIIKLINLIKTRYFSIETRMMVDAINTSGQKLEEANLEKLKEEEAENIVTNYCPICGSKLIDFKCEKCNVNLDNIYDVSKYYCVNCGTKRADLEPDCSNCGLCFNI